MAFKKTKKWWDKQYERYVAAYKKTEAKQKSYGLPMADKLIDRKNFEHEYKAAASDLTATQKKNRESVIKRIVKDQRYEVQYSKKQQSRLRKYGLEQLEKAIDTGDPSKSLLGGHGDFVTRMWEELTQYMSSTEAAEIISSDIFGSP